jgi:hypothetical protein
MLDWLELLEKVKNRQEYVYICSGNFTPSSTSFFKLPQSIVLIFCVSWFTQQENVVVGFSGR